MTDEEKKAIEFWQGQVELYSKEGRVRNTLQILLNVIENQDNRIKELEKAVEKKYKIIEDMEEWIYSNISL